MLDKLVATQKENNTRLAAIEKSVNALVSISKQTEKREALESKRARALARQRKPQERKAPAAAIKKEKKEGGGFLSGIFKFLKGPLGIAAVGGLIIAALNNEKVREAIGKAFETLSPIFMDIAQKMGEIISKALLAALKGVGRGLFGNYGNDAAREALDDPNATKEEIADIKKLTTAINAKKHKEKEYYRWKFDAKKKEERGDKEGAKRSREFAAAEREKVEAQIAEIETLKELAIAKGIATEADFRFRTAQEVNSNMGWFEKFTNEGTFSPEGLQRGGSVRVPGSGSGDTVPAVVSPGSFVMNREASKVLGFQTGGAVPVMLEPGEQVFSPGSWGPVEMAMNSIIPRFQTGGFVGSDKVVDTGYRDYKGRPAKLSPAAAKGLQCMIDKGMPWVPADVRNVYRDRAEYQRLLSQGYSPAKRSKHNFGEAMDVHGRMGRWIRSKGKDCGWGPNDYSGSHGGHYEFFGSPTPSPARDETYSNKNQTGPGGVKGEDAAELGGQENLSSRAGDAAGMARPLVDNPVTRGAGDALNFMGAETQKALRKAGLPGMADIMHVVGEGFKQSKAFTVLPTVLGAAAELGASLMGGLGNLFTGKASAKDMTSNLPMGTGRSVPSNLTRMMNPGATGAAGGDTQAGASGSDTSRSRGGGEIKVGSGASRLLDFISKGEGGYNSMNQGTRNGRIVGSTHNASNILGKNLTDMTINEVMALQASGKLFAAGRYQIIPGTMREYAFPDSGLKGSDKFTPQNQDKMGMALIKHKRPYAYEYLTGKHDDLRGAMVAMAKEWASLPHPDTGNTIYGNGNRALHSVGEVRKAMQAARAGGGFQSGGIINMTGAPSNNLRRYEQAMNNFKASFAESSQPIVIPMPMGGGGGGGSVQGGVTTGAIGTPPPPDLPSGPQVVALLELQNRLALGAAL